MPHVRRAAARVQVAAVRRSGRAVGAVLVFHAIEAEGGDPRRDLVPALSVGVFREALAHLAKHFEVVPPSELRSRTGSDRLPVALTFDDDLSSHTRYAAPLLAEHGMPATFFLTGRTLDGPDPFWWQDLQSVVDRSGIDFVLRRLQVPWADQATGLRELARTIEGLRPSEREPIAAHLRELAGDSPADPGLPSSAVAELAAGGFEIGFHTLRHDALPVLTADELDAAMNDGRARLGDRLRSIAYPHGLADLRVSHAAERAGFETGFVWRGGPVRADDPPRLLDRADGWSPSADRFAWQLARVLGR